MLKRAARTCVAMRSKRFASTRWCARVRPTTNRHTSPLNALRARAFQAEVHDIEELGGLGKRLGACPYYGTRKAARLAEVGLYSSLRAPGNGAGGSRMPRSLAQLVVMPYSVLLHKQARESMGARAARALRRERETAERERACCRREAQRECRDLGRGAQRCADRFRAAQRIRDALAGTCEPARSRGP